MHKLTTLRWALPAIVMLTVVTIAIVAVALVTGHNVPITAWLWAR